MKLNDIIKSLKCSKFECVAGPLENHVSFRALESMSDEYNMCCLGPAHPCKLNVNDGFCCAIECMFQVHENNKKLQTEATTSHTIEEVAPFDQNLKDLEKLMGSGPAEL